MQHAITRAKERYGVDLTPHAMTAMKGEILGGRAVLLAKPPDRRSRYLVRLNGVVFHVVYDEGGRFIVTILPGGAKTTRSA